jgi:hypothetical protein
MIKHFLKLTVNKILIKSIMTYTCPASEFAADNHLLKLQRLQNKVLRTIRTFPRLTPVRGLHMAFKHLYIYCGVFDQRVAKQELCKHDTRMQQ